MLAAKAKALASAPSHARRRAGAAIRRGAQTKARNGIAYRL
jgi:hypothetical protein